MTEDGIPLRNLPPQVVETLRIAHRETLTVAEAKKMLADLPWFRDRALKKLENIYGPYTQRQKETIRQRYEDAESFLWKLVYPPHIGSPFGYDEDNPAPVAIAGYDEATGTFECRYPSCTERISREARWLQGGACSSCHRKATEGGTA